MPVSLSIAIGVILSLIAVIAGYNPFTPGWFVIVMFGWITWCGILYLVNNRRKV